MYQKQSEANYSIFKACCYFNNSEPQIIINQPQQIFAYGKENKISLKKIRYSHNKNSSSISSNNKGDILTDLTNNVNAKRSNKNHFQPIQRYSTPINKFSIENQPLQQFKIRKTMKTEYYQQNQNYLRKANRRNDDFGLQKTSKMTSHKKIKTQIQSVNPIDLQKTKLKIVKRIQNLSSFKESIVSFTANEPCENRLQQSIIVVDYFHPDQTKEGEISKFLSSRQ